MASFFFARHAAVPDAVYTEAPVLSSPMARGQLIFAILFTFARTGQITPSLVLGGHLQTVSAYSIRHLLLAMMESGPLPVALMWPQVSTPFSNGLGPLRQAEVVKRVLAKDGNVVPADRGDAAAGVFLALILNHRQVFCARVVWIENQKANLTRLRIVVHAQNGKGEDAPADADGGALGVKVLCELSALVFEVVPRRYIHDLA